MRNWFSKKRRETTVHQRRGKIDRCVGRRTKTPDALSTATSNKADAIAWRKALGGMRVPRGVHRFKTHEEADQWLWRMIAR